jgi:hypothetical protein
VRDPTPKTTPVDYSAREFAALEQYAKERGLTVEQVSSELAHEQLLLRVGAPTQVSSRVLPFRRR